MNRVFLLMTVLLSQTLLADDYSEGREFALNLKNGYANSGQINPNEYLNGYTESPNESHLDTERLKEIGERVLPQSEAYQEVKTIDIKKEKEEVLNESSNHISTIEHAEESINGSQIPCANGDCLPTHDEDGHDFAEGVVRLGVVAKNAEEVSAQQIRENEPRLFVGQNLQCRVAAFHAGNCCGGHARLLNCSQEEKNLAIAILESRAVHVGKYCVNRKLRKCIEEKESWCVFPSTLAGVIQIQGRGAQLGIDFGWANHANNRPNCRGITPIELERIRFDRLNLSAFSNELQGKYREKDPQRLRAMAREKIRAEFDTRYGHG